MKCDPLEFCDCQKPWTSQWSTSDLEEKAKAKRISKKKRVEKDDDDSEENIPIARKKASRNYNQEEQVYAMHVFGGFSGTPSPAHSSLTLGLIQDPKPLNALPASPNSIQEEASPVENKISPSHEDLTDVDKDTIYN
ncbi:hypothetical protein PIB30_033382 [Stylosanthes scabra]|uniref:Uncharacterized protein n=1 Tax=Stylosanthes scabra TaxID=79078 RepID=A0ABU6ZA75_9FABA|nr:hypothetical protein [Stylosanthes scabra]